MKDQEISRETRNGSNRAVLVRTEEVTGLSDREENQECAARRRGSSWEEGEGVRTTQRKRSKRKAGPAQCQ